MTYKYIFLPGRPGCGTPALYRELQKRIPESGQAATQERLDDFPKMWATFLKDDALARDGKERIYSSPTHDGDYLVTNDSLFSKVLEEINAQALQIDKPDHVVFLEFARPKYVEALRNFDSSVLDVCIVIYIDSQLRHLLGERRGQA